MGESETSLNFLIMHKLSVFSIGHAILSSSVSMTSADYFQGQFFLQLLFLEHCVFYYFANIFKTLFLGKFHPFWMNDFCEFYWIFYIADDSNSAGTSIVIDLIALILHFFLCIHTILICLSSSVSMIPFSISSALFCPI